MKTVPGILRHPLAAGGGSPSNRFRRRADVSAGAATSGWSRPGGLALVGIGIVLAGFGVRSLLAPVRFEAATQIKINREPEPQALSHLRNNPKEDELLYLETELKVINSPIVLDHVVETGKLNAVWGKEFNHGLPLKTSETRRRLEHSMVVRRVPNINVVEIVVSRDKAQEAADLANWIAEAYRAHKLNEGGEVTENYRLALEKELDAQEAKVREAETNVDRLRVELKISEADASSRMPAPTFSAETVQQFEAELIRLKNTEVNQATTLQKLTNLPPTKLREAIQLSLDQPDAELSGLIRQSDRAQENLIKVAKDYTPDHPSYLQAKQLADQCDQQVNARIEGILIGLNTRLDRTKATIDELSQRLENARTNDTAMIERSRPFYAEKQKLRDSIEFKRILETKIASLKTNVSAPPTTSVEILEPAEPPQHAAASNQTLGVGLIVSGGLLGLIGIVLWQRKPNATGALSPS